MLSLQTQTSVTQSPSRANLVRINESSYVKRCPCGHGVEISAYKSLRAEAGYWRKMHEKAISREDRLKKQVEQLEAKVRLRERQLFGKKNEKQGAKSEQNKVAEAEKKPRGQQKGASGHGRQANAELPIREEIADIASDECFCSNCGLPFEKFPGTEDSTILEVEIKAHKRQIKRIRYKKTCTCNQGIVTAPAASRLIPKGKLGVSIWAYALLDKFHYYNPTYRMLRQFKGCGLTIPQGTLTDGFKRLQPLFAPVYEAICEYNRQEDHWHADETRWKVFEEKEGKIGYNWYLWVFRSKATVVFIVDPGRSAKVIVDHLQEAEGIISCDRYSAYKAFAKHALIILAFCWAHVRRDFLDHGKSWPKRESWAMTWIEAIGELYHINNTRLQLTFGCTEYHEVTKKLKEATTRMEQNYQEQLSSKLHPASKKVLESLKNHWAGLTIFIDHPDIPMDNNKGENSLRGPVTGRKSFYGSGCQWSGELAAYQFSILQTLELWGINLHNWMTKFLTACANHNRELPKNWKSDYLPWNMNRERLDELSAILKDTS